MAAGSHFNPQNLAHPTSNQSAFFTDKEAGGTNEKRLLRGDLKSSFLEEDQEEEAIISWKQWLLLKR